MPFYTFAPPDLPRGAALFFSFRAGFLAVSRQSSESIAYGTRAPSDQSCGRHRDREICRLSDTLPTPGQTAARRIAGGIMRHPTSPITNAPYAAARDHRCMTSIVSEAILRSFLSNKAVRSARSDFFRMGHGYLPFRSRPCCDRPYPVDTHTCQILRLATTKFSLGPQYAAVWVESG
jgi:hypothetical protein